NAAPFASVQVRRTVPAFVAARARPMHSRHSRQRAFAGPSSRPDSQNTGHAFRRRYRAQKEPWRIADRRLEWPSLPCPRRFVDANVIPDRPKRSLQFISATAGFPIFFNNHSGVVAFLGPGVARLPNWRARLGAGDEPRFKGFAVLTDFTNRPDL